MTGNIVTGIKHGREPHMGFPYTGQTDPYNALEHEMDTPGSHATMYD
jgi:hypothetical protein